MIGRTRGFARIGLSIAAAIFAGSWSFADGPSPEFIHIQATNDAGTGTLSVPTSGVTYNSGTQQWEWSIGATTLMDGSTPVANINSGTLSMGSSLHVLSIHFNLNAGVTDTFFSITTGTLSFPTVNQPQAGVSGGLNVVDQDPNFGGGVLMTGTLPDGVNPNKVFRADYNGAVPTGTLFFTGVESVANNPGELSGSSGAFGTPNGGTGGLTPVGTPISDMSMQLGFTLSARDNATGNVTYGVIPVPEPATLVLLVLGAAAALRRR